MKIILMIIWLLLLEDSSALAQHVNNSSAARRINSVRQYVADRVDRKLNRKRNRTSVRNFFPNGTMPKPLPAVNMPERPVVNQPVYNRNKWVSKDGSTVVETEQWTSNNSNNQLDGSSFSTCSSTSTRMTTRTGGRVTSRPDGKTMPE